MENTFALGKIEGTQSDCRILIPSVAVKEGWRCGNTDCKAFGQWYCMYNW
jgi:hypothetical protein